MLWQFWEGYNLLDPKLPGLVIEATPQGEVSIGPLPGLFEIVAQLGGSWELIKWEGNLSSFQKLPLIDMAAKATVSRG
jgi:hypothetical protein